MFAKKNFDGKVPEPSELSDEDNEVLKAADDLLVEIEENLKKFRVRQAIGLFMEIARRANKYFNDGEPWVSLKQDRKKCANTIYISIQIVKKLAARLDEVGKQRPPLGDKPLLMDPPLPYVYGLEENKIAPEWLKKAVDKVRAAQPSKWEPGETPWPQAPKGANASKQG